MTTDRARYAEALRDGQTALDETLRGDRDLVSGAVGVAGAIARAWLATRTPACGSCAQAPAGKGGLCDTCRRRPRLKS